MLQNGVAAAVAAPLFAQSQLSYTLTSIWSYAKCFMKQRIADGCLAGSMAYGFASGVCKRLASETRTLGSCPIRIRNPCVVTTRKDSANTYFLLFIILLRAIELGKTKGCITRVAVSDLSTRQDRSLSSTRHWYLCSNAMQ